MNLAEEFNALHGKEVSRTLLEKLYRRAISENNKYIANRISKVLDTYNDDLFTIEIEDQIYNENIEESYLSGVLPYIENDQDETFGLAKSVSQNDIYDLITELILNTIKSVGHLPWQQEWKGPGSGNEAKNYVTCLPYTGVNFLLNFDIVEDPNDENKNILVPIKFDKPYYLTFNQIIDAGAKLKKGSKGREVFYYTLIYDFDNGTLKFKTNDRNKFSLFVQQYNLSEDDLLFHLNRIPIIKYYNVFRADDCENLDFSHKRFKEKHIIQSAQDIVDGYKDHPRYKFSGSDAYYSPKFDFINMPKINAFENEAFYYCTFFHEMIHSTGSENRLNRDFSGGYGTKSYAFEELIAELGAVFLCSEAGILFHTKENSAKYLAGWNRRLVENLEKDNRFFFKASAQAQKAANYILGRQVQNEQSKETKEPVRKKNTATKKKITPKKKTTTKKQKVDKNGQYALFGAAKTTSKVIEKEQAKTISSNPKIKKIGASSSTKSEYFQVAGQEGEFLQAVEKKPVHSVVITMDGEQGAGKTTTLYKFMNSFASTGNKCLFISGEEHPESDLAKDKVQKYLSSKALNNIDTVADIDSKEELYQLIDPYEIVFIDSWQKLIRMIGNIRLDEDLRKKFHGKVFVIIFQQTTTGRTKGGSEVVFDGDIIIKMVKEARFSENYAYFDKNRYTKIDLEDIRYNIASAKVYNPNQLQPVATKSKLSFKVN